MSLDNLPTKLLGNKRAILPKIMEALAGRRRVLDLFAGSGIVSLALKSRGVEVACVESRVEAWLKVWSVVENDGIALTGPECERLLTRKAAPDRTLARAFGPNAADVAAICRAIGKIQHDYRRRVATATLLMAVERRLHHFFERAHRLDLPNFGDDWIHFASDVFPTLLSSGPKCRAVLGDAVERAEKLSAEKWDAVVLDWPYAGTSGYGRDDHRVSRHVAKLCGFGQPAGARNFSKPAAAFGNYLALLPLLENIPLWVVCSNDAAFFPLRRLADLAAAHGRSVEYARVPVSRKGALVRADELVLSCRQCGKVAAWRRGLLAA